MASQTEETNVPSPEYVGNAFVRQYYLTLDRSPDMAHKFYTESSTLSRLGPDGLMTSVTTLQGINDAILSMNYHKYHIDIKTTDSQFSHYDGVIVLVTGFLVENNDRKKFVQTFFLAPTDAGATAKAYVVLNDVLRFVDDVAGLTKNPVGQTVEVEVDSTPENLVGQPVEIEMEPVAENEKDPVAENGNVALENSHAEENGVAKENGLAGHLVASIQNEVHVNLTTEEPVSPPQDAAPAPKKSFASVVNALKQNAAPFHVRTPLTKPAEQPRVRAPAVPKPEAPAPTPAPAPVANGAPEKSADPAAKVHAIFVANLPMSATVEELDKLFKQFGPIKRDGIQIRSSKLQGTCFGFVEFESASSMQSALEASPIVFGARKLSIEERRANNERPKYTSGRTGYRNDNFRGGRGNFNGNRSFGRNEFERRSEFSGRARGNGHAPRNGEVNHKPNSNVEVKAPAPEAEVKV